LTAVDAIHVAAAKALKCDEFMNASGEQEPISRLTPCTR
jgi:hypothetical protein